MGGCNCTESRPETNAATFDGSLKYSVDVKVQNAKKQMQEAVFDFENSQTELDKAGEKKRESQLSPLETDFLTQKAVPAKFEEYESESDRADNALRENDVAAEAPILESEEDFPMPQIGKSDFKEFILSKLTPVGKDVYVGLGNFRYVDQASEQVLVPLPLGDIYFGDTNKDKSPNGFGLLLKTDGSIIEGAWVDGSIHGEGLQVYSNGDSYVGSFDRGEVAGKGKFVNYKGATYEGEWDRSKQNGQGTETWSDGAVYEGQFEDGKKEGFGRFLWADRARYEGEFHNNNLEGKGRYTWSDGRIYDGSWKNNKMHGYGTFQWPDGKRYEGQYVEDQKNGMGVFIWPNGKRYEGMWKNNRMHGKGEISLPNGTRTEGEWVEGKQVGNAPS